MYVMSELSVSIWHHLQSRFQRTPVTIQPYNPNNFIFITFVKARWVLLSSARKNTPVDLSLVMCKGFNIFAFRLPTFGAPFGFVLGHWSTLGIGRCSINLQYTKWKNHILDLELDADWWYFLHHTRTPAHIWSSWLTRRRTYFLLSIDYRVLQTWRPCPV